MGCFKIITILKNKNLTINFRARFHIVAIKVYLPTGYSSKMAKTRTTLVLYYAKIVACVKNYVLRVVRKFDRHL